MKSILYLILLLALPTTRVLAQAHGHINAGAEDTNHSGGINAGDRLFMYFEAGTQTTTLAYNGGAATYGQDGFLWNGYTTFTALHQSSDPSQAPDYNSLGARSGSFLQLKLVSITGPGGATIAFYETGGADPSWSYRVGDSMLSGDGAIDLTELAYFGGVPEEGIPSDPYGHIHGRMFGTDTAGTYTATWILTDTESASTGLLDSVPFTSTFTAAAVPEPAVWTLLAAGALLALVFARRKSGDTISTSSARGPAACCVTHGSEIRPPGQ